jgi:hypothetical protein
MDQSGASEETIRTRQRAELAAWLNRLGPEGEVARTTILSALFNYVKSAQAVTDAITAMLAEDPQHLHGARQAASHAESISDALDTLSEELPQLRSVWQSYVLTKLKERAQVTL